MAVARCKAKTKKGIRCTVSWGLSDAGLCLWHDPDRRERAREVRSKGGKANKRKFDEAPPRLETLDDAVTCTAWVFNQAALGNLPERRADVMVKAVRQFQSAINLRDLERQAAELKRQVKELKKRRSA